MSEMKKHMEPNPKGEEPPQGSANEAHLVWEDEGGSLLNAPPTQDEEHEQVFK